MAAFPAGRVQRRIRIRIRIRIGMAASAVLCLAGGLLGVLSGNMQIRDIGIIGYGVVFPFTVVHMARLFTRSPTSGGEPAHAP